jgi:hypothetical protein
MHPYTLAIEQFPISKAEALITTKDRSFKPLTMRRQ